MGVVSSVEPLLVTHREFGLGRFLEDEPFPVVDGEMNAFYSRYHIDGEKNELHFYLP
jgi:hypothetical protein